MKHSVLSLRCQLVLLAVMDFFKKNNAFVKNSKEFIFFLSLSLSSCTKNREVAIPQTNPIPTVTPGPAGMLMGNKEYFWGYAWQKDSAIYEMKVDTWRLTDSAINRGIKVYAAIYTDWSSFDQLPLTLTDVFLPDTVNLSYTVTAGHLKVFAKAPFDITWQSDVMIDYQ